MRGLLLEYINRPFLLSYDNSQLVSDKDTILYNNICTMMKDVG